GVMFSSVFHAHHGRREDSGGSSAQGRCFGVFSVLVSRPRGRLSPARRGRPIRVRPPGAWGRAPRRTRGFTSIAAPRAWFCAWAGQGFPGRVFHGVLTPIVGVPGMGGGAVAGSGHGSVRCRPCSAI